MMYMDLSETLLVALAKSQAGSNEDLYDNRKL